MFVTCTALGMSPKFTPLRVEVPFINRRVREGIDKYVSWEDKEYLNPVMDKVTKTCQQWEEKRQGNIFVLREGVSYSDARKEIIEYLENTTEKVYMSDIIINLRFDLETVLKVLDELKDEGVIERTD